jgi:folate-binding protein YgfZ
MTPNADFFRQYNALTGGVGFASLQSRTILEMTGSDRVQILQSFTTNDIKRIQPGEGCEAFVTSGQGKTLSHIEIFCDADRHVIDTAAGQAQVLIDHFNRYVITEDVTLTDKSGEFVDLLVAGNAAERLLSDLTGSSVPPQQLGHAKHKLSGHDVTICHVDYAGPLSYFVRARQTECAAVVQALEQAGAVCCDSNAVESARLEAGFPLFGLDITPENLPQEIARDKLAISFTKGCYLGQETVARIDAIGHVNRLLVGVEFAGEQIPGSGMDLFAGEQKIGAVTSAAWSPRLQAPLALALVRRSHSKPGNELETNCGQAVVVALPLAAGA